MARLQDYESAMKYFADVLAEEEARYRAACRARGREPAEPGESELKRQKGIVWRLLNEIESPNDFWDHLAHKTNAPATWFADRAATLSICRHELRQEVEAWQRLNDTGSLDMAGEAASRVELCQGWATIIKTCPTGCPIENRKKRQSKRESLKGLPDGWPELILGELRPKWKGAWALAVLTGARPAELARGVTFSVAGDLCTVMIKGAKLSKTTGQPWRELTFEAAGTWLAILREIPSHYELPGSTDAFSEAVRRASRRLWPRRKHVVSAYSARHLAASRWKAGGDPSATAKAMGHAVLSTQSGYGQRRMGGGGNRPDVVAARTPRDDRTPLRSSKLEPSSGVPGF